jgi:hypothetical protein
LVGAKAALILYVNIVSFRAIRVNAYVVLCCAANNECYSCRYCPAW